MSTPLTRPGTAAHGSRIALVKFIVVLLLAAEMPRAHGQPSVDAALPSPPPIGDDSAPSLRAYEKQLLAKFGPHYRDVPLEVKSEFFEWMIFRYLWQPGLHVFDWATLAEEPGIPPSGVPGSDTSTWNGALLAALSYKYAVTRDPQALEHLEAVLRGLHRCLEVTGKYGHIARSVNHSGAICHDNMLPYKSADGGEFRFWDGPAKGTYNQVVGGYARVMMLAWHDLPPDVQQMCQADLTALVRHVVDHDYHLTDANGNRPPYGNLTPVVAGVGVPFNAQVAYQILAAGRYFIPPDSEGRERVENEFRRVRGKHHAYYAEPWRNLVRPQEVGASPFVKGMNDRAHVTYAAFVGLEMDLHSCRTQAGPLDEKFLYRLGQTMLHGRSHLRHYHDSLTAFMWAAMLSDPRVFDCIVKRKPNTIRGQMEEGLVDGVENLRRFRLDRFSYPGEEVETHRAQWADGFRPGYRWHQPQTVAWRITGSASNNLYSAIDFLHAYWLLRYYGLEKHPKLRPHHWTVLQTPVLR